MASAPLRARARSHRVPKGAPLRWPTEREKALSLRRDGIPIFKEVNEAVKFLPMSPRPRSSLVSKPHPQALLKIDKFLCFSTSLCVARPHDCSMSLEAHLNFCTHV